MKNNVLKYIKKSKEIHGDKYDYSKINNIKWSEKICIICPKHGEFWQRPNDHLNGQGCKECYNLVRSKNKKITNDKFIERAKEIHGEKYDYSKVKYVNNKTKVCVICPEHGEFYVRPDNHLKGCGCTKCKNKKNGLRQLKTITNFICEAKEIHGEKYDYSKVEYKGIHNKVCIMCPKHGEFWQTPNSHLHMKTGCPICNESKLEKEVASLLDENNIKYERQKHFLWLRKQSLDFYLPDYDIAIECQGRQHFEPIDYFGGEKHFKYVKKLDKTKYKLCMKNNIKLLYYSNEDKDCLNKDNLILHIKISREGMLSVNSY